MRHRLLLVALWITVLAAVALFDWGVTREARTDYSPEAEGSTRAAQRAGPGGR
jgi:hypothetical protein